MHTLKRHAAVKGSVTSAKRKGKKVRKSFNRVFGIFVFALVRRLRPSLLFDKYTYQSLCDYSKGIELALTGNLSFPTPPVTLVDQGIANDLMQSNILECGSKVRNGSLAQRIAVRDAAAVIKENIRLLADYVDSIAQGDEGMIVSSGMTASKTPVPRGPLPAPTHFRRLTKDVVAGLTPLKWNKVQGAVAYNVYAAATPTDPFVLIATVSKTSFNNVGVPGRLGYYTVRAVGAAGLGIETAALGAHSAF